MPFPRQLPPPGTSFEDMLVYAASEMPYEELGRYIGVLEDEIGRSNTPAMVRAVDRLKREMLLPV